MICSSCGAPINHAPYTQFAFCDHCGTRTEIPVILAEPADNLRDDLEQVDLWWNQERRPYMRQDRHGHLHPPEEHNVFHVTLMAIGGILGLISAMAGHTSDWDWLGIAGFFLFPILISLPAALLHQRTEQRYKAYKALEAEYQGRRNAIVDRYQRRNQIQREANGF